MVRTYIHTLKKGDIMENAKKIISAETELLKILDSGFVTIDEEDDDDDEYESHTFRVGIGCQDEEDDLKAGSICQWTTENDIQFSPCGKTVKDLPPGMYNITDDPRVGIIFDKVPIKTQGLLKLSGTDSSKIFNEIVDFWTKENVYKAHDIAYKRGILLWGPPGSGKSSLIQMVVEDVVNREGICMVFEDPYAFKKGMRRLREIQKNVPVVVIMEDIDSIIEEYSESAVLNILDGLENISGTVFLATTNHPEKLGMRICNRPSRFDRRFMIDVPSAEDRRQYLENINKEKILDEVKIKKWIKDTDGFTFAHIKELFVSVAILNNDYAVALDGLKRMKNNPSKDGKKSAGFSTED